MEDDDGILELDLPDGVVDANEAIEVMRAWVTDGTLNVIIDPETFRHDVSEWGRLLSDIAHHISNAVELDGQINRFDAIESIRDAFEAGLAHDTLTMTGKIKGRTEH